jgi:hypothetical protein
MKPFDVQISFTGICAAVPDDPDLSSSTRACVVMPGFEPVTKEVKDRTKALDETPLCPHQPYVRFDLNNAAESAATGEVNLRLNRRRLRFAIDETQPSLNRFHVVGDGGSSIFNLLQLKSAAPDNCVLDPKCIGDQPPNLVQGQAVLDRGELKASVKTNAWRFPPTLGGQAVAHYCARYVVLELRRLNHFALITESFDGTSRQTISLFPAVGKDSVFVKVTNSCIDYPDPQWEAKDNYDSVPDVDFRWYYHLLPEPSKKAIIDRLQGLPLPYPYPVGHTEYINHGNCWPMLAFTKARQP